MVVLDMIGPRMMFAFSKMEQVIALNVETINSFCLPHLVEVSALRMLSACFVFVMVTVMSCKNVNFRSKALISKFLYFH